MIRDTTYRVSSIKKLVVQVERGLVIALPIRLQRTTCSSANVSTTVTSEMRGTHQLSLQVQHPPVHLLLTLPLDLLQSLRGIRLPVQPVERVRLLEGVVVAFRVCVCVVGEPARGLGHRERGGILVRLEEQKQLRLQRVAVARVEAQDCRRSPEAGPGSAVSNRLRRIIRAGGMGVNALLSHVLIALAKCPPSSCAQSEVKSLLRRSATGSGCFGVAAFWRVVLLDFAAPDFDAPGFVADFVVGLGGMMCGVMNGRRCCR